MAFGKQVYLVGKIGPHATITVELSSDRTLSGYLKEKSKGYMDRMGNDPSVRIDRTALMYEAMFHDSESRLANDRSFSNDSMHDVDLTGQLLLPRPMLVAQVNRPASRLVLDNAPSPPKVDQTTLVRIILPLTEVKH